MRAMSAVRAATFWAASGGVVTTTTSVRGIIRASPIWMSPVPGGMSTSRKSRSPQWTSSRNCWTARLRISPRHMMAWSSSARNPIDRTRRTPSPTARSSGTIFLSRASTSPCMPSRRGTENPQMSASSTPTVRPRRARATARLTVTELLPTPPLPEATAMTRVVSGTAVAGASSRARSRARAMTARFWSASMTPGGHGHLLDAGEHAHVGVDVALDLGPQRAAGDGERHLDVDVPVVHPDRGHHAQVDDVGAQLGVDHVAQGVPDGVHGRGGPAGIGHVGPGHPGNCSWGRWRSHRYGVPPGRRDGYDRRRSRRPATDQGPWHQDLDRTAAPSRDHKEQP